MRGERKFYKSSDFAERSFCADCGSSLVQRPFDGDWIAVTTGTLDNPEKMPPKDDHCGIESQMPWLKIDDDLPRKRTEEVMGWSVDH